MVSLGARDCHIPSIALLQVRQSSECFILRLPKSFPPPHFSQRQGVRLTIASSLSETGGVTHCDLCVLAVSAVSKGSGGGRVRGAYVVTLVSVGKGRQCVSLCRLLGIILPSWGAKSASSSPSVFA